MQYLLHILILIGIYVILSSSLNLVAGYAGLISVAHASFFAVGAYAAALLSVHFGSPLIVNLLCAALLAALCSLLIGFPSLRIRDDYFVIATFGFQVLTFSVLNNWVKLTRGPLGIPGIPRASLFGWEVSSQFEFLVVVTVLSLATIWCCKVISESPYGRVLKAIREDEMFATAAGKNVAAFKISAFAFAGGLASIGGVLYAHYISFVDPSSFTVMESIFILSIVIIGGAGSLLGPVVGAVLLVSLPEALRLIGLQSAIAANVRQILYGGLLLAFMLWRPRGLLGRFSFEKDVH
jgi:branched-chain amino acid transport system permease protein